MAEVFNITHNAGNLSEYTSTETDSGDLSADAAAALAGTAYGLKFVLDDTTKLAASKELNKSTTARFRFYLDPNSLTMANNDTFVIMSLTQWGGSYLTIVTFYLKYTTAGGYEIFFGLENDIGTDYDGKNITDAPHYIEMLLVQATNSTSANGTYEWWVDGTSEGSGSSKDNYNRMFDQNWRANLSADTPPAGTSGTFYMDEFKFTNDSGVIGPVAAAGISIPVAMYHYMHHNGNK